jgi:hypothetical protein
MIFGVNKMLAQKEVIWFLASTKCWRKKKLSGFWHQHNVDAKRY